MWSVCRGVSGEEDRKSTAFLDMIPLPADLQASWLLLLHCAAARANFLLRVVEPGAAARRGFRELLVRHLAGGFSPDSTRDAATMPLVLGGIGLRSAVRNANKDGHGRLWSNLLWPIRLWPIFWPTLANRGLDRLWPNRLWPILVF